MNFKHYINNPKKIISTLMYKGFFNWLDDEKYIKLGYRIKMGKKLNLKNPISFNEKIQWLKLYDRKKEYSDMVDKFKAKEFVANIIGEKYIVPTIGVWDKFDEINFSLLPKEFVLKCTHDSGGLIICRNKELLDKEKAKKKIEKSLKRNYFYSGREWAYKNVEPRIIAEKFLTDNRTNISGLTDFKFFCFNGEPLFLYVSQGLEEHSTAGISFYDLQGKKLPFKRMDYREIPGESIELPNSFNEMIFITKKLAKKISSPFIRVDLYDVNGKVYFSELTFSPCSGLMPLYPRNIDIELGKKLYIQSVKER